MNEIRVQGRWLSDADRDQIRRLRPEHPEWSRLQLSVPLAEQWQWRKAAGRGTGQGRAAARPYHD